MFVFFLVLLVVLDTLVYLESPGLFRCTTDDIDGDDGKDDLWQQDGQEWRQVAVDGEDRADLHEDDEGEGEGDADGEVEADATAGLAARHPHSNKGHDDDGQRVENSLVELDFGGDNGTGAPHFLADNVAVQLDGVHGFDAPCHGVEVVGRNTEVLHRLLDVRNALAVVACDDVVVQSFALPFLLYRVVDNGFAGDAVDEPVRGIVDVAVEVLDAQGVGVVAFRVNLHPLLALEMNVAEPLGVAGVDVLVFECRR